MYLVIIAVKVQNRNNSWNFLCNLVILVEILHLSFHFQLTQYNHFEKSYCLTETRCEVTYFVRVKILGCYSSWSLLLQFNCWYNNSKLSFAKNRIHFFVLNHVHLNSIIKTNTVGLIWFGLCCHMLLPFPSVHQI